MPVDALGRNPRVVPEFERIAAILAAPVPAGSQRYTGNQDSSCFALVHEKNRETELIRQSVVQKPQFSAK